MGVKENRTPPALRGSRNVPVARFAEQGRSERTRASPADALGAYAGSILRASTNNTEARRWRASLLARAENRRSQNQLRALRAKNNSQDCFYGAARRRANSRASTNNSEPRKREALSFPSTENRTPLLIYAYRGPPLNAPEGSMPLIFPEPWPIPPMPAEAAVERVT